MVIERALDAGYVPISFLMEEKYLENQGKAFMERCPDVPVYTAELSVLQNLIGYPLTRGMLCAMRRRPGAEAVRALQNIPPHRRAGERDEPDQRLGAIFSLRRRPRHGRRAFNARMQRSILPPRDPRRDGHGLPDSVDLCGRGLAGAAEN